MIKKCKCKKCAYCQQICLNTSVPRINCEKVGMDMVMPAYCVHYTTKDEYNANVLTKSLVKGYMDLNALINLVDSPFEWVNLSDTQTKYKK